MRYRVTERRGIVNNQIKIGLLIAESVSEFFLIGECLAKLQARARLANTLLNDGESARDNHVLACDFAKYLPI